MTDEVFCKFCETPVDVTADPMCECDGATVERLAARLKEAVKLLRRFKAIDRSVRPHFLSSDVELFLRKIGGGDG